MKLKFLLTSVFALSVTAGCNEQSSPNNRQTSPNTEMNIGDVLSSQYPAVFTPKDEEICLVKTTAAKVFNEQNQYSDPNVEAAYNYFVNRVDIAKGPGAASRLVSEHMVQTEKDCGGGIQCQMEAIAWQADSSSLCVGEYLKHVKPLIPN